MSDTVMNDEPFRGQPETPDWCQGVTLLDVAYAAKGVCEGCAATDFSPNVEAFELTAELLCDECAESAFEASEDGGSYDCA